MLSLSGMELDFFIEASVVLFFGFITKTTLITNQCFSYCWTMLTQHVTVHAGRRLGVGKRLGEDTDGTPELNWPKSIPFHVTSCLATETEGRVFLGRYPLLGDWLAIVLLVGGGERLPLHHLFISDFFSSSVLHILSIFWPMRFLAFAFSILSTPLGREGVAGERRCLPMVRVNPPHCYSSICWEKISLVGD